MEDTSRSDIELYDRAIYEYLAPLSEHLIYAPTAVAVKTITKNAKYKDCIPAHFISFYRDPNFDIDNERYNFTAATHGDMVRLREFPSGMRDVRYVQNIPVNLTYQVDVWSPKATSVQKAAISVISKLFMQEQVIIANTKPDEEPARFHITLVNWVDNSDLEVEDDKGRLYRHTITITIDARIKLVRDLPTTKFPCVPVDIYENQYMYETGEGE